MSRIANTLTRTLATALAAILLPLPALACAVELILAVDTSGSIDDREFALQMEGTAAAFEHPSMINAIEAQEGGVQIILTQWSGRTRQRIVTEWHLIEDAPTMAAFATAIRRGGRHWRNYSTAIGEALEHAKRVGETVPQRCKRRIVDVSGDGISNEGREPRDMAQTLAALGYSVNGLVIRGDSPDPVEYYRQNVLAGPRSFLEVAEGFEDYPRAILRKLLREIEEHALVSHADQDDIGSD
ncbi:MAG: DUF1194 domain-containing protein [Pseudomonadota bacterium]